MTPHKNIVLIGFMGSGKTVIAKELAQRLNIPYVSSDALIEQKEGGSITDIFKDKGEAYFRNVEHEVVKSISSRRGIVIDCGGGVVLNSENLKLLKTHGIVFYLQASVDVIYQRIKNEGHRPLLKVPDPLRVIRELYTQRLPLYSQADVCIDANDASIEGPVVQILQRIQA